MFYGNLLQYGSKVKIGNKAQFGYKFTNWCNAWAIDMDMSQNVMKHFGEGDFIMFYERKRKRSDSVL